MGNNSLNRGATKLWWIPLVTGILALAIGVWCLFSPLDTLTVLAWFFAAAITAAGVMNLAFGIANTQPHSNWGWSLALGLIEIICGIWLFMMPEAQLITVFIYTIALYLIFVTINAICEAFVLAGYARDWLAWMLLFLFAALVFAIIFLAGPIAGGIAVWLYIGISFIAFGLYRIILAFKLRKMSKLIRF
ncbi:MAG: hypothetical protein HDS71_06455 [Bacteroidales bacterium]|nr:hypothetical protein [Bacteroidales bacterium]MBD5206467.1 hypothetical protein [Bacteroidales bacterium]MBD5223672.1 hypothetical protein [Bacteroidales bacterium]MBD5301702.1 hypothetical protein [Bacteroides sp.]